MTTDQAIQILKHECYIADLLNLDRTRMVNTALDTVIEAAEQEPKMGRWIFHKPFDNGHKNCNECIECSQCHTWLGHNCYAKTPYCPICGARMAEESDEE